MSRPLRAAKGGLIYHTLNRGNTNLEIFSTDDDYAAFEHTLAEAVEREGMRLLAYCLMPTHFHLVLWPRADGELSQFMRWLTLTHTQRWHSQHQTTGTGHVYQGRFRSFPIQPDDHFLTVCRYVERNPLRAGLVARAQDWRWCSLWSRLAKAASASAACFRVAGRATQRLDPAGQPTVHPVGRRSRAREHPPRSTLWISALASQDGGPAGSGVDISPPRSSAQECRSGGTDYDAAPKSAGQVCQNP